MSEDSFTIFPKKSATRIDYSISYKYGRKWIVYTFKSGVGEKLVFEQKLYIVYQLWLLFIPVSNEDTVNKLLHNRILRIRSSMINFTSDNVLQVKFQKSPYFLKRQYIISKYTLKIKKILNKE